MFAAPLIAMTLVLCMAGNAWSTGFCCYCRGPEDGTPLKATCTCAEGQIEFDPGTSVGLEFLGCNLEDICEDECTSQGKGSFVAAEGDCYNSTCEICPLSYLLGEDDPRLDTLRRFRDEFLAQTAGGRELIDFYYRNGEIITIMLQAMPYVRQSAMEMIETMMPAIEKALSEEDTIR